jgi:hypothetical protein
MNERLSKRMRGDKIEEIGGSSTGLSYMKYRPFFRIKKDL